jgi:hypothetical protein
VSHETSDTRRAYAAEQCEPYHKLGQGDPSSRVGHWHGTSAWNVPEEPDAIVTEMLAAMDEAPAGETVQLSCTPAACSALPPAASTQRPEAKRLMRDVAA